MTLLLSLRPALTVAAALVASVAASPAALAAVPTDADLLAVISAQAPETTAIVEVAPAPGQANLAIRTRAQTDGEAGSHDELWLAAADGTGLVPLSRSTGSAAQYVSIGSVSWSADGHALVYGYLNPAVKTSTAAHVVTVDGGTPRDQRLGDDTTAPEFTLDGRYVTFLQYSGGLSHGTGALDRASGQVLLPARVDYLAPDGSSVTAPYFAKECARATQAGWTPAQTTGRWLEQALASPDPGCRFGANAADAAAAPNPASANDAPASITKTVGTNLVTISDRTKPIGPTVRIRSTAKGLTRAIRRGLRLQVDLAGAQRVKAYVITERPAAEDLLKPSGETRLITLGRAAYRDLPSQTQALSIPLTREAKRLLPRFLKITVTVRIVATDKAGNRTTVERQVALTDF